MDTRLTIRDEALMPTTFDGLLKQAAVLVKSGMLPEAIKTPEAAVVIMLKGRELDIPPMQAFASIYVVKGKPTIGAQLMGALILRDGHSYHVEHLSDEGCVITFTRRGGKPYTHKFTIEDATKAGLLVNDTWKKYTKAMLFSRCMSAGARIAMPDVLAGMYTPEELSESVVVDAETGEITPTGTIIEGAAAGNGRTDPPKVTVVTPGASGKLARPIAPEMLKGAIATRVAKAGSLVADEGQRGALVGALNALFASDAKEIQANKRHMLLQYLTGKDSSKALTGAEIAAILPWASERLDSGEYVPDKMAAQEAALVVKAMDEQAGQTSLL